MGHLSRKPTSNDPPKSDPWPYGGDEFYDDFALLVNYLAKRCAGCNRVTRNKYLDAEQHCPVCRAK